MPEDPLNETWIYEGVSEGSKGRGRTRWQGAEEKGGRRETTRAGEPGDREKRDTERAHKRENEREMIICAREIRYAHYGRRSLYRRRQLWRRRAINAVVGSMKIRIDLFSRVLSKKKNGKYKRNSFFLSPLFFPFPPPLFRFARPPAILITTRRR